MESQTIRWSVIVLSVALILVYVVLYYVKSDLRKMGLIKEDDNLVNDIVISDVYGSNEISIKDLTGHDVVLTGGEVNLNGKEVDINYLDITGIQMNIGQDIQMIDTGIDNEIDIDKMIILSGTKTYYGELDFVEKLRIGYNYALIDDKGIYYLNMTDTNYDYAVIVRKHNGSLYVINTDQELIANSLFGDKVTFINIPDYKNKKVLLLLDIDNQSWLLAIDYSIYHQVKPYLKSLFIY